MLHFIITKFDPATAKKLNLVPVPGVTAFKTATATASKINISTTGLKNKPAINIISPSGNNTLQRAGKPDLGSIMDGLMDDDLLNN